MSASPPCPRCGGDLAPLGAGRMCRTCRGAWVSDDRLAEMVRTMKGQIITEDVVLEDRAATEAALKCPACAKDLEPKTFATQAVDRCADGHGVWLDGGELAASLREVVKTP